MWKALGWIVFPVVTAGGLVAYTQLEATGTTAASAARDEKVVTVRARLPEIRDLPIKLSYPAEIQPIQVADMRSIEARGFVRSIFVDKGDRVKKGQLLVTVDCPDFRARARQAEEEIRNMRATYANAQRIFRRLVPLRANNFISEMELDTAKANHDSDEARLRNAEARLAEVQETLGYCQMRAPFDGEVAARHKDPGAQVRPGGRPVLTLMRIDAVRIWVNVVERDASFVREGLPVELSVHALPNRRFSGKVTRFSRAIEMNTRTLLAEVEVPNPGNVLKPGMYGRIDLLVDRRPRALLVPRSALLTQFCRGEDDRPCTWLYVLRDGRARRVEVDPGYVSDEQVEIVKGIEPRDPVVYAGRDLLGDGTRVQVVK